MMSLSINQSINQSWGNLSSKYHILFKFGRSPEKVIACVGVCPDYMLSVKCGLNWMIDVGAVAVGKSWHHQVHVGYFYVIWVQLEVIPCTLCKNFAMLRFFIRLLFLFSSNSTQILWKAWLSGQSIHLLVENFMALWNFCLNRTIWAG